MWALKLVGWCVGGVGGALYERRVRGRRRQRGRRQHGRWAARAVAGELEAAAAEAKKAAEGGWGRR